MGNMTVSYHGRERLPESLRAGRIGDLLLEIFHTARRRRRGLRMAVGTSILPFVPAAIWRAYDRRRKDMTDPFRYTALAPDFAREIDYEALAAEVNWNLDYQPWADGHALRVAVLRRTDLANYSAGHRAAFGVDHRDPTMDRRIVEFCLGLPTRYFFHRGVEKRLLKRLARDQLPAQVLYPTERKGYQAVDWHESLTRARSEIAEEIERLEASPLASRCLDLPKLRRLVDDWPTGDWHSFKVTHAYRLALLRGIAMGRFIRRMEGGNQ
jgi:asparagine synthase (glutamine-hydrolysing)